MDIYCGTFFSVLIRIEDDSLLHRVRHSLCGDKPLFVTIAGLELTDGNKAANLR